MAGQHFLRWRLARERPVRVILLDAASDVGAWDEQVELVRQLDQVRIADRVGILGWNGTLAPGQFLDAPAACYDDHHGRGRVIGIPLCSLEEELAGGAARVLAVSSGTAYDADDWESGSVLWPSLRLLSVSQSDLAADRRPAAAFLGKGTHDNRPVLISVPGNAAIVPCRPDPSGQALIWGSAETNPGVLACSATDHDSAILFDVLSRTDAHAAIPALSGANGWTLEQVTADIEDQPWEGPLALGDASFAAVLAYLQGRPYDCPRDGTAHQGSLHCPAGRRDFLPGAGAHWAVPELDRFLDDAADPPRWVALVLSYRWRAPDPVRAALWSLASRALFYAHDLLLTRQPDVGTLRAWQAGTAGWAPASLPRPTGQDNRIIGWHPAAPCPWEQPGQERTDAFLLHV